MFQEKDNIPPLQISSVRSLVLFLLVGVFIQSDIVHLGKKIFTGTQSARIILVIRAILNFLVVCSVYWAIEDISVHLAPIVFYTFTGFPAVLSLTRYCRNPKKLKFGWLCSLSVFLNIFCDEYFNWMGSNRVAGLPLSTTAYMCYTLQLPMIRARLDM